MIGDDELDEAQEKAARLAVEQLKGDARAVMASHEGRRFVWYLLEQFGIYRTSYSREALAMAYNEGRRSAGLQLMDIVSIYCPEQYVKMTTDQRNEGET